MIAWKGIRVCLLKGVGPTVSRQRFAVSCGWLYDLRNGQGSAQRIRAANPYIKEIKCRDSA